MKTGLVIWTHPVELKPTPKTVKYRVGDFEVTDYNGDWSIRMGKGTIEKEGDCIMAEMINFTPNSGVKYGIMYQFPDEKLLIEL